MIDCSFINLVTDEIKFWHEQIFVLLMRLTKLATPLNFFFLKFFKLSRLQSRSSTATYISTANPKFVSRTINHAPDRKLNKTQQ